MSIPGGITSTPPQALTIGLRPANSASQKLFATNVLTTIRYACNFHDVQSLARTQLKGDFKIGQGCNCLLGVTIASAVKKQPPVTCHISCTLMTTPTRLGSAQATLERQTNRPLCEGAPHPLLSAPRVPADTTDALFRATAEWTRKHTLGE